MERTTSKACFLFGLIYLFSCTDPIDQNEKKPANSDVELETRSEGLCQDCAEDKCCCSLELTSNQNVLMLLCGVASPTSYNCSGHPPAGCASMYSPTYGFDYGFTPTPLGKKLYFCAYRGYTFWLGNPGSSSGTFKLSCQGNLTNPQIITITIPVGGPYYFSTDSNCELSSCN